MVTNYSKIPIKLAILLVGFGLLVAGCDSTGPSAKNNGEDFDISYKATNDLGERISSVDGESSSNAKTNQAKAELNFRVTDRVEPPSSLSPTPRASHLALSENSNNNQKLYIGYKAVEDGTTPDPYAGGIDIVGVDNGFEASPVGSGVANALVVDNVDIQEVGVWENGGRPHALFAATAVENDVDGGLLRPPQLHSIDLNVNGLPPSNSPVEYEVEELLSPDQTTRIAKGVATTSSDDPAAYTVSDENTLHEITLDGTDTHQIASGERYTPSSSTQFRSVVNTSNGVKALGLDGTIHNYSSPGSWGELASLSSGVSSATNPNDLAIARLTSHDFSGGGEFVFAALGQNGFRIINASNGTVVSGPTDGSNVGAASVTATDNYIFAASGDGLAIYSVDGSDPSGGLSGPSTASISDLQNASSFTVTDAQVNYILVDDSGSNLVLYVAKSDDGVYRLEESSGGVYNP